MSNQTYASGEVIYRPGDSSEYAYNILDGQVELLVGDQEKPVLLAVLGEGEIFGEMGLVEERPRSMTARAIGAVTLEIISRDEFTKLLTQDPVKGMRYLRSLFERLRVMNNIVGRHAEVETTQAVVTGASRVTILANSRRAHQSLPANGVVVNKFPFRIGRAGSDDDGPLDNNDLVLQDSHPYTVSRNHFAIERRSEGFFIVDRGSRVGTTVNGVHIGGKSESSEASLRSGENSLHIGARGSHFRLHIRIEPVTKGR